MRKSDVETRSGLPAINIKVYRLAWDSETLEKHFGCAPDVADKAAGYAFDSACEQFWENIPDVAREIFGPCRVYSDGRSGGWLVVHDLPDVDTWDAVMLSKWAKFSKAVKSEIAYQMSFGTIIESISANEWAKPHAERFNFVDTDNGTVCIADLKADAIAAGYGPVIRR